MPFPEKSITGEYGTLSAFRRKNKMQPHSGTDWAPAGSNKGKTLIPAIASGTIKLTQWSKVLGWVVVQTAADKDGKIWFIGYCHLACKKCGINCKGAHGPEVALSVKVGDKVQAGDVSHGMTIGNTGNASSGAHLHATLGKAVKDVFGPTTAKSDLKKAIIANGGAVAPKVDKKTAKAIIKGTPAPAVKKEEPAPVAATKSAEPTPAPITNVGALSQDDWKALQEILKRDHGYVGAIDGQPGTMTHKSLQRSVVAFGYSGPIDGDPGSNTYKAVQRRLVAKGVYEGRIDGSWGPQTIAALREAIRTNKY
jgi:biotin carboxyl carrier protein